jgi:hypothetical protein
VAGVPERERPEPRRQFGESSTGRERDGQFELPAAAPPLTLRGSSLFRGSDGVRKLLVIGGRGTTVRPS